jgi:hypothetical protein
MRLCRGGALLLLLSCGFAGPIAAQSTSLIMGRVLDEMTDRPIAAALVELLPQSGRGGRIVADSAGRFALPVPMAGMHRLRATGIGYAESLTAPFAIGAGDTLHVIVRMHVDAVRLPALEVVARSRGEHIHPGLADYYYRMRRGMGGSFITREEIEARSPRRLSDVLYVPGVTVTTSGSQGGRIVTRRGCSPSVYIDGVRMRMGAFEAVNLSHPSSVEGLEIYPSVATLPGEYADNNALRCGAIGLWTRRGPPRAGG